MFWICSESVVSGKQFPIDKYPYMAIDEGPYSVLSTKYDMVALVKSLPDSLLPISQGMFRYLPFLPIKKEAERPAFLVGGTPLVPVRQSQFPYRLFVKDEGVSHTGSLKDRSSALVCVKAKELGFTTVATASSGNAAAATSAMAAGLGLSCVIFMPNTTPKAKIVQNQIFGSKVYLIDGNYDEAVAMCMKCCEKKGWYNRSTAFNQFSIDGKKTVSFELCEQLSAFMNERDCNGTFLAPDVIISPCGVGNILSGIHKGLVELFEAKLIDKVPKLIGCQVQGSNSLYVCWKNGDDPTKIEPMVPFTKVGSLSTAWPNDAVRALRAIRETGGAFIELSDEQVYEALPEMARVTNVFAEPGGATVWAGLKIAQKEGYIKEGETVVLVNTGNGLKDIDGAIESMKGANSAVLITDPDSI